MAVKATGQKLHAIEASCAALGGKLTGAVPRKQGHIRINLTDTGEELHVDGAGRAAKASRSAGAPLVEISGPSAVIKSIMDGKKEASRAFVAGGLQVKGDLIYLEALLKDLGVLQCSE